MLKNRFILILLPVLLITVACAESSGDDTTDSEVTLGVNGQLKDTGGAPIANATLSVSSAGISAQIRAATVTTSTTTDGNGFYRLIVKGGSFKHTISIKKSDGTDLGSIDIKIKSDNTLDSVDTSNASSVTISKPAVKETATDPTTGSEISFAGTYNNPVIQAETASGTLSINNEAVVVDSTNKFIFSDLRGAYFSKDGALVAVPIGGVFQVLECTIDQSSGLSADCNAPDVTLPDGTLASKVTVQMTRANTTATVTDSSGELFSIGTTEKDQTIGGWSGATDFISGESATDKASGAPTGSEIKNAYIGWDSTNKVFAVKGVFDAMNSSVGYRFTLLNDNYSEILFDFYSNDGGTNWDLQYRINDSGGHKSFTGTQGTDWGFVKDGTTVEFFVDIDGTMNSEVDTAKLSTMEFKIETRAQGGGDTTYDVAYPVIQFNLN